MTVTITEWYRRVNAAWPQPLPELTEAEARRAAKRLWKWATGNRLPYAIEYTSGRRHTWERHGVLYINASKGWSHFVHLLSHLIWRRENVLLGEPVRPHEKGHAKFELRMRREVLKRGWLDVERCKPLTPGAASASAMLGKLNAESARIKRAQKREARLRASLERAEAKMDRLKRRVAKLRRKVSYYDRKAKETE